MGFIQPSATETFSLLIRFHNFVIMEIVVKEYVTVERICNEFNYLTFRKKNFKNASLQYIDKVSKMKLFIVTYLSKEMSMDIFLNTIIGKLFL